MMKNLRLCAMTLATLVAGSAFAEIPSGYYNNLEGLSGVELKRAAKNRVYSHTEISYGDATWEVFKKSDVRYVDGKLCYWDMYSDNNVPVADGKPDSNVMNIEHGVANSWWGGGKNAAYKDLFHLNPSNSAANSRKGNYPMSDIKTVSWDNGVTFIGSPVSGQGGGSSIVYEPADEYKGDFARAFFYMFTVYDNISWQSKTDWMYDTSSDLTLKPWAYELLLKWSEEDPVSWKEIDRNEAIYQAQRNRNPFIDNPKLARHIWGDLKGQPFHFDDSYVPGQDPDPTPGPGTDPDPDDPVVDPTPVPGGMWYAVQSTTELDTESSYVLVSVDNDVIMAANLAGKYMDYSRTDAQIIKTGNVPSMKTIPSDAAIIRLAKTSGGYALHVSSVDGEPLGYICSTEAKTISMSNDPSVNGCTATITPNASYTEIDYGKAGNLLYNASAPRFLTYTSDQEKVMLYRLEEDNSAGMGTGYETAPEVLGIYDINGRKMNTLNIDDLDGGVYIVVSNFGAKKIFKQR